VILKKKKKKKKTELRSLNPRASRLLAKLVPTLADKGCHMVSVTDPYGRILVFLSLSRKNVRPFTGVWANLCRRFDRLGIPAGPIYMKMGTQNISETLLLMTFAGMLTYSRPDIFF
jgi:hypothetical protein